MLVVDDDALTARVVGRVLAREHDIVDVRSARDAMARVEAGEQYDFVLCDLIMPHMTGMELHHYWTKAGLPIADRMLFMTGGAFTPEARDFVDRLRYRCIQKPFDAEQLRELARGFLR